MDKDLRGIPQTFLSPRDIETTRDKIMDSVIRNEKRASNYIYEDIMDSLNELF